MRHNRCKHYTNCPSYWTSNRAINRWIHLAEWWTKEWINAVEQSQIKRIVHFQYLCIRAPNTIPSIQHHIEFVLFKVGEIIYTLIRKSYSKMHDCSRSDQSDCNMKWTHFFPFSFWIKKVLIVFYLKLNYSFECLFVAFILDSTCITIS